MDVMKSTAAPMVHISSATFTIPSVQRSRHAI